MKMTPKYKGILCSLAALGMFLTSIPVSAGELGVVTGNVVNLRTGPGTTNAVIAKVAKGESYPVLTQSDGWAKIRLNNGQEGWISRDYLNVQTIPDNKYVIITGKVVNLRSGPGTGYSIIAKTGLNEKYPLLAEQKGWYKILVGNKQGWISATLSKLVQEAPVTPPATTPTTPPAAPPSVPNPGTVPVPQPDPQSSLVVTGDIVNIRSSGNLEAQILDKVSRGTRLPVLNKAGDWYQVQLSNGKIGWIAGWLVEVSSSAAPSRGGGTEVLSAPLSEGKSFKILDVIGRPTLVLEGWQQDQYKVGVQKQDKTITLELDGATKINYTGNLTRLGIQNLKITPQGDKALINLTFAYTPAESITYDADKAISYLSIGADTSKGLEGKLIVVDPGHSGVQNGGILDPGAIGRYTNLQERTVTLDISQRLRTLLENAGARVIMTHNGITPLSLTERAGVANNNGAAIFVSIHCNSSTNKSLNGHTTYFYAPVGDELLGAQRYSRQKLAALVQREMVKAAGRKDQGIKEENFAVLRETRVPSILVETAFLSDRDEEILLGQPYFRQKLAEGIFNGIKAYFEE